MKPIITRKVFNDGVIDREFGDGAIGGLLLGSELVIDGGFLVTSLGSELVTGTDSDMSGANNWTGNNLGTFDINTTVAGKMYALGDGSGDGGDWALLPSKFTIGKSFFISCKARLNTGASTEIKFGRASAAATTKHKFGITPTGTESTYSGCIVSGHASFSIGADTGFNTIAFEFDDMSAKQATFDNWTLGDGAGPDAVDGSLTKKVNIDGSQAAAGEVKQTGILTVGQREQVVFTITRSAGTIKAKCGTASGTTRSLAGTYTEDILCAGNTNLIFEYDADFVGTIDTVSAKEIIS